MSKMSSNGNDLYRRYILDSIVEKAKTYSAFKKFAGVVCIISYLWMMFILTINIVEGSFDITTPIIVTTIISVINCLLPSTQYFAETMVINNKDIVDIDKFDAVMEVKTELRKTY
jgi:hypothetical protein